MKLLRDTWLIYKRQMGLVMRQPTWIFIMLIQPLYYLILFGPLLNNLPKGMPGFSNGAMETFVPGLVIMMAMFGTLFAGFGLIAEIREGVIERMRVTPVSRFALLLGRSMRDVSTLIFQAVVLVLLSAPIAGLTINWGGLVLMLAIVLVIGLALSAASYGVAIVLKSEDALAPLLNTITQPVLLLSGIMLPMALAPDWLKTVAKFNPFAYAVDAARALFVGDLSNPAVWQAGVFLGALMILLVFWSGRKFARSAS
ncbi:MAG TPA: ABC transporter permease [Stackebrandtia sp.]|jgi:ABC-2 type transport system permease protein|uniref:ABC transporter permease n=1 Tax=Stackebrandtia sp. TaxID=2023065 RepID=UPI002D271B20|nr:ABC transporter permease [Stackebrandtia sp.]HZE39310.1 ABC transporter permease [Stackebrandtia sp.]